MSITVSVTGNNPAELKAHIAWLADKLGATSIIKDVLTKRAADVEAAAAATEAVVKIEQVFETAVAAEKVTKKAKGKAATTVEPSDVLKVEVAEVAGVSRTDLQALAANLSNKFGSTKVREVVSTFGAPRISGISDERLAEVKAALDELNDSEK